MVKEIAGGVYYLGASDFRLNKFENLFPLPEGVSYNSYLIKAEKTALLDTVDCSVADEFLFGLEAALGDKKLDYIVVHHLEPDHSATLRTVARKYPEAKIVLSERALPMLGAFYGQDLKQRTQIAADGSVLDLGGRALKFFAAPMVHWPEVLMSFEPTLGILFSADAFGSFGAISGDFTDNNLDFSSYLDEMRRYYSNIVGKYGNQVKKVLSALSELKIKAICPLHGAVLEKHIDEAIEKYWLWADLKPESEGVFIPYSSIYGHTKAMAFELADEIARRGVEARVADVSAVDISYLISSVFKYKRILIASVTYNGGIFPKTENLLEDMRALGVRNRCFAVAENGSWAPSAGKQICEKLSQLKDCAVSEDILSVRSAPNECDREKYAGFIDNLLSL